MQTHNGHSLTTQACTAVEKAVSSVTREAKWGNFATYEMCHHG